MIDTELDNLIEEYEFSLTDTEKDCLINEIFYYLNCIVDQEEVVSSDSQQIAELIKFLRSCMGNEIQLTSKVEYPYQGQIKGWNIKCSINDYRLIYCLEKWLNFFLDREIYKIFQPLSPDLANKLELGEDIEYEITDNPYSGEDIDFDIGVPYSPHSDEALNRIIEDGKTAKERIYTERAKIGDKCGWLLHAIQESQVIPDKTTKTKLYSFVYDCLVLLYQVIFIGKGFQGGIGREKYTLVRDWIRTAKNQKQTKGRKKE